MLNLTKKYHIPLEYKKSKLPDNIDVVKYHRKMKWEWEGHAAHLLRPHDLQDYFLVCG